MYSNNIRKIFLKGINRKMSRLVNWTNRPAGGAVKAKCLLSSSSSTSQDDLYLWCVATASPGYRSSIFNQAGSPGALIQWQTTHSCMRNCTCASGRVHKGETRISNSSSVCLSNNETDEHEAALWSNTRRSVCFCSCTATAALLRHSLKWRRLIETID